MPPVKTAVPPLAARLAGTRPPLQPLLNFLMLHGHLRPGYDYLLDRKLTAILREAAASPLGRTWPGSWPVPRRWATRCGPAPAWPPKSRSAC